MNSSKEFHKQRWMKSLHRSHDGRPMFPDLQEEIYKWSHETFGATSTQVQKKLQAEYEELDFEIDVLHEATLHRHFLSPDTRERAYERVQKESADVLFMLFQLAEICEFDLIEEVRKKFEINKSRTWEKQADGTYQHVEAKS